MVKLTDAVANQSAYVVYDSPVSSNAGLSIDFNLYEYGGTGGDGIGFFLTDGSQPILNNPNFRIGGFGGSLGYAPRTDIGLPGITAGYLGIGFDAFGNYSNPTEGRIGGPGVIQDGIAVRGSVGTGYKYLTGTPNPLPISLDQPTRQARKAHIDLTPAGLLTVEIDLNGDGDFNDTGEIPIKSFNVISAGNGALPSTFRFGFAASTGSFTNVHEVDGFNVRTYAGAPIPGNFTGNLVITGGDGNDTSSGDNGNDDISGGGGNDIVTGLGGDDQITGGAGADLQTGGTGADRFIYSGPTKAAALKNSTFRARDLITDFNFFEGDRIQLDFDSNLATSNRPKRLFNAGKLRGNLKKAVKNAYADKNQKQRGQQALKPNEAVFFKLGQRTYLSVNDNKAPFSVQNDLLVDMTGIVFRPGDAKRGALRVGNYFI
jgi:Ca2+-binding RTX toxin-like protein